MKEICLSFLRSIFFFLLFLIFFPFSLPLLFFYSVFISLFRSCSSVVFHSLLLCFFICFCLLFSFSLLLYISPSFFFYFLLQRSAFIRPPHIFVLHLSGFNLITTFRLTRSTKCLQCAGHYRALREAAPGTVWCTAY